MLVFIFHNDLMKVKIKINAIFHFIILGGLGQKGLSFFLLAFLELSLKMVTNMKLAFTNVPFRHTSACVI